MNDRAQRALEGGIGEKKLQQLKYLSKEVRRAPDVPAQDLGDIFEGREEKECGLTWSM